MGENSKIQWCDHTFNPWVGCTKVSPGCKFCYAEADMDQRRHFAKWGPNGTRVVTSDANWSKPLKWNREAAEAGERRIVFCSSLADVFEDWSGPMVNSKGDRITAIGPAGQTRPATMNDIRLLLFRLIEQTPHLTWLLLTKRPENIRRHWTFLPDQSWRRHNVWLYTSVEDQEQAYNRIEALWKCREMAPVLGLSCEPLLENIDLRPWLDKGAIDHVIVGGESGLTARPFHSRWAGRLIVQCHQAGVPFFMKQFGSNPFSGKPGRLQPMKLQDRKGGDPDEWSGFYKVRELPEVKA